MRPLVSIIVPAYNAEKYIANTINSVRQQTYDNWNLMILDDCSTDNTKNIVRSFVNIDSRIHLYENSKNSGAAIIRNIGIELAGGEWIAFLDSDDLWHREKLEKQLKTVYAEGAELCYTSYAVVDGNGKKAKKNYIVPKKTDYKALLKENVIGCSTVLLRADLAKKYCFDTNFYLEDYALWLDLLKDGYKAVGREEVLVDWYLHSGSRSYNKIRNAYMRWQIYRKKLQLPIYKSAMYLCSYAAAGLKKYK